MSNKSKTYIACAYNRLKHSTYTKKNEFNVLRLIEKQLATLSKSDQIKIEEDFNSRIGTKVDFIVEDRKVLDFLLEGYKLDPFSRHSTNEDISLSSKGSSKQ